MLLLMNSAMMPMDGTYTRKTITIEEFRKIFQKHSGDYKSYIGYLNACRVLSEELGTQISLCRDTCDLRAGDIILACILKYRVNPDEKEGGKSKAAWIFERGL